MITLTEKIDCRAMNIDSIPKQELDTFRKNVKSQPNYLDVHYVREQYKKYCRKVVADPFDFESVAWVNKAIEKKLAMSLVRMGDGEINLLTYPKYDQTPTLNEVVARKSIDKRLHSFNTNEQGLYELSTLMETALIDADVVGVLGLWRPSGSTTVKDFLNNKNVGFRGLSGQWRGIDYMLEMACTGRLSNKLIVSAHNYLAVVQNIDILLAGLDSVWLITSETAAVKRIKQENSKLKINVINLPKSKRPLVFDSPYFLHETRKQLPNDLAGKLVLIGAGPWAEIYAYWIKQRGGIAIDIGTGFDLLAGKLSRPVHRRVLPIIKSRDLK